YDTKGRLAGVTPDDSPALRYTYTYTDLDELATIEEPGTSIENVYENGRCVRQVNRFSDSEPLVFTFVYHLEHNRVVGTDSTRSDGRWTRYTWDAHGRSINETSGYPGLEPASVTY